MYKNCIPNEWRNYVVIAVFHKGGRRDPTKLQSNQCS